MIYLIRHGQTDWNIEHRTQGQTDIALNINGIEQAKLISQKIANLKVESIISSDLKRAYMTAQIINKKFNKTIETDKRLREFCFGTLEGITRDKITQEIWDDFNENPKKFNAESKEEIFNRIKSFINDIKSNNINKNILVVTHGGPIKMIKYYLDNVDIFNDKKYLAEYMTIKINNLDIFIIDEEMNLKKYDLQKDELDELLDILSSSIGSLTNPLKLSKTFKSIKNKTSSDKTISNYIGYFEDSFLISKAKRYDVKGKRYINSPLKYYFEDIGLRNARLNFRQTEESHAKENIIYNEL